MLDKRQQGSIVGMKQEANTISLSNILTLHLYKQSIYN